MKYSKEFKEEALKLSDEIGLKKATQQLGIQYYTLSDWRSKRSAAIKAQKYQMTESCGLEATEFHTKIYSNTVAKYWSDGFLELDEMNIDETNTTRAFKAIEATLNQNFKKISSPDHMLIRNNFIGYLRHNEHIDYPTMVNSIMENYQPVDPEYMTQEKVASIRTKLLEQPQKRNFDNQFSVKFNYTRSQINEVNIHQINLLIFAMRMVLFRV